MSIPLREGSRATPEGIIISKYPDICRSPIAPVPYTIIAYQDDDANTASSVFFTKQRAHKQNSFVKRCIGDEPGTGLGIKSHTVSSICQRKTHSKSVRIEGEWATRHDDEWWMNNKNTVGKLCWPKNRPSFDPTPPLAAAVSAKNSAPSGQGLVMSDATAPDEWIAGAEYAAQAATVPRSTSNAQTGLPELPGQSAVGTPGGTSVETAPPLPANDNAPPEARWWNRVDFQMPAAVLAVLNAVRSVNPSGPGAMEAMAFADRWLQDNVNDPVQWWSKGVWRVSSVRELSEQDAAIFRQLESRELTVTATDKAEDDKKKPCTLKIGTFRQNCGTNAAGEPLQDHHIYADFMFRSGARPDDPGAYARNPGHRLGENGKAVLGVPDLKGAPSICLDPRIHTRVHNAIRVRLDSGTEKLSNLDAIMDINRNALLEFTPPECWPLIMAATSGIDRAVRNKGYTGRARERIGVDVQKKLEDIWGY